MLLLVGLGNPGQDYAGNRHNIGFMVADEIVRCYGFPAPRSKSRPHGMFSEGRIGSDKVIVLKPLTYMNESGQAACRLPRGHPEAFFEAFANVYRSAYDSIVAKETGSYFETKETVYPNVYDGVEGMYFIQQCVASSKENGGWLPLRHELARR